MGLILQPGDGYAKELNNLLCNIEIFLLVIMNIVKRGARYHRWARGQETEISMWNWGPRGGKTVETVKRKKKNISEISLPKVTIHLLTGRNYVKIFRSSHRGAVVNESD